MLTIIKMYIWLYICIYIYVGMVSFTSLTLVHHHVPCHRLLTHVNLCYFEEKRWEWNKMHNICMFAALLKKNLSNFQITEQTTQFIFSLFCLFSLHVLSRYLFFHAFDSWFSTRKNFLVFQFVLKYNPPVKKYRKTQTKKLKIEKN